MIYVLQLTGLAGLGYRLYGKVSDLRALGGLVAVGAGLVSLIFWDAW
ncbi:hypothetical protein ACFYSF_22665 [Streptomyces canus]